jgi:hypothetical protein
VTGVDATARLPGCLIPGHNLASTLAHATDVSASAC